MLQQRVSKLSIAVNQGPRDFAFGGGEVVGKAGLPYQADTYMFTSPLTDCEGGLTGYLVAFLDWTRVEDILFEYAGRLHAGGLERGEIVLVDWQQGRLLSSATDQVESLLEVSLAHAARSTSTEDSFSQVASFVNFLTSVRIGDEAVLRTIDSALGTDHPVTPNQYQGLIDSRSAYALVTYVLKEELTAVTHRLLKEMTVWTTGSILLLIGLIFILARSTVAPITALAQTMDKVARGDLEARVDTSRQDEIGNLATVFNTMATALKKQ